MEKIKFCILAKRNKIQLKEINPAKRDKIQLKEINPVKRDKIQLTDNINDDTLNLVEIRIVTGNAGKTNLWIGDDYP